MKRINDNVTDIHAKVKVKPTMTEDAMRSTNDAAFERFLKAGDDLMRSNNVPSGRRLIVATIVSFLAGATTYYWAIQFAVIMAISTVVFTGSQFLAFIVAVLGFVMAVLAAVQASSKAFDFVAKFDVNAAKARMNTAMNNVASTSRNAMDFVANKASATSSYFVRGNHA